MRKGNVPHSRQLDDLVFTSLILIAKQYHLHYVSIKNKADNLNEKFGSDVEYLDN